MEVMEEEIPRSSILCMDLQTIETKEGGVKLSKSSQRKVQEIIFEEGLTIERPPEKEEVVNSSKNIKKGRKRKRNTT
jgi:hypothetical protein